MDEALARDARPPRAEAERECERCTSGVHGRCGAECACACTFDYEPGRGRRKRQNHG